DHALRPARAPAGGDGERHRVPAVLGIPGGDRARVHRAGPRVHRLEQAGGGRGAGAAPPHALLQDAPSRDSPAPAVTPRLRHSVVSPITPAASADPRNIPYSLENEFGSLIATLKDGIAQTNANHVDRRR